MSGCTLIALAADEIIMDQDVALGPLDLQIQVGGAVCPAPSIIKVAKVKGNNTRDDMLVLADIAENAISEIQSLIVKLLEDKLGRDEALEVAKELIEGKYIHDYPITVEEVKKFGLNVKTEIPPLVAVLSFRFI